jgi:hypothetical protein
MLFGFAPKEDGKATRQQLIQQGKQYHQMLYTLLNELSADGWHQTLMLPYGWASFMSRCFGAYIRMRKAECDLTLDRGEAADPEENKLMNKTAWLW